MVDFRARLKSHCLQRWMQTDFRQERRWKQATAFEISTWILEYHAASPERRKNELCIKTRPPNLLPTPREGEETGSRPRNAPQANEEEDDEEPDDTDEDLQVKSELLDEDGQHHASTSAQPLQQQNGNTAIVAASQTAAPLSFGRVIQNRGPLFEQSESKTTISLSDLPLDALLPSSAKERTAPELLAGLLPDLGSYAPPAPPSNDEEMFRARRTDLSSPSHSRLTPVSRFMDDKPLLLSTLNPASKRKWATGEWEDLSDLYTAEDPPQPGPVPDASAQSSACRTRLFIFRRVFTTVSFYRFVCRTKTARRRECCTVSLYLTGGRGGEATAAQPSRLRGYAQAAEEARVFAAQAGPHSAALHQLDRPRDARCNAPANVEPAGPKSIERRERRCTPRDAEATGCCTATSTAGSGSGAIGRPTAGHVAAGQLEVHASATSSSCCKYMIFRL